MGQADNKVEYRADLFYPTNVDNGVKPLYKVNGSEDPLGACPLWHFTWKIIVIVELYWVEVWLLKLLSK